MVNRISSVILDCPSFSIYYSFTKFSLDNLVTLNFILSKNVEDLLASYKIFETCLKFKISSNDKYSNISIIISTGSWSKFPTGIRVSSKSTKLVGCNLTFLSLDFCTLFWMQFPIFNFANHVTSTVKDLALATLSKYWSANFHSRLLWATTMVSQLPTWYSYICGYKLFSLTYVCTKVCITRLVSGISLNKWVSANISAQ